MGYAELHCLSNFSFQRAASQPAELVERAHALGYMALAMTDECSMAGVVRAHEAAKACGLPLIIGSEFRLSDGPRFVLLAKNQIGYSQICRLISRGRKQAKKGCYELSVADCQSEFDDDRVLHCIGIWKAAVVEPVNQRWLSWWRNWLGDGAYLGVTLLNGPNDTAMIEQAEQASHKWQLPLVACGDVRMHRRSRRALLDVLSAVREHCTVAELGFKATTNGERHLRSIAALEQTYPAAWLANSVAIAESCGFSLENLSYQYPHEITPSGQTPTEYLRELTERGVMQRWPGGESAQLRQQIERELALIEELSYEAFFLTVYDVVRHAREQNILCQGRGSAANSVVCYCLGITEVNPADQQLLFERFISRERNEPPDIDVDFEHQRREEVIQYVYTKYGRDRAALAATVACYRPKGALRDIGKALGISEARIDRLSRSLAWWDKPDDLADRLRECGLQPDSPTVRQWLILARELIGFPRHLSQHVGGFVIAEQPLHQLVPIENASMPERTVIQWDKDDLESLGLLKVDCLALGMLTAVRRGFELIRDYYGERWSMDKVLLSARENDDVFQMMQRADTIGVFQIESRAQQSMLPRLKPKNFYDLVVQIAIVRPGPIQGQMVHPYLRRRNNPELVEYPSPELRAVLERTLGVPIFQEQVMQIAIVAAGYTPGEADGLRRSMAAWKRRGGLEPHREKLTEGMLGNGYSQEFAEQIFNQIKGFGDYGFPESHSASFALIGYVSSWLKCRYPAVFCCALLNSQPMGFYAPAQLIADARRHGVEVLPVDVRYSFCECVLERHDNAPCIRLGFQLVKALSVQAAERIVVARQYAPFVDVEDLTRRAALSARDRNALAQADALTGLVGHRHRAQWSVLGVNRHDDLLNQTHREVAEPLLPKPSDVDDMLGDYAATGLSLKHHPVELLRPQLPYPRLVSAGQLPDLQNGRAITAVGLVTHRQRPATASGVIFMGMEDETGVINVIIWPSLIETFRREVLECQLLRVEGHLQNDQGVQHLVADALFDESHRLQALSHRSRDFH